MALHEAGLLHGMDNNFLRIVRIDMTTPETLTHDENFNRILQSVELVIRDIDHIESLIPLPTRWPWNAPPKKLLAIASVLESELRDRFNRWCETHDFLYDIQ
jgi:hypothetical protein